MSFRTKVLRSALVTLAFGLAVLVALGNVLLDVRVHQEASSQLRTLAAAQLATVTVESDGAINVREVPNDAQLDRRAWVLGRDDAVLERPASAPRDLDAFAVGLGRDPEAHEFDGPHDVAVRVEPIRDGSGTTVGAVVVGVNTAPLEDLQKQVALGSLIVAALVLLAAFYVLRRALDGALEPVARMTADAQDWGAHDLDRRFALGPPRDELTGLAATLDGLLDRIASSRRHEQRFAAEVAHELRTPIAGLRGRAELALSIDAAPADREAALRAVVERSETLTETVDTLLAVARRELDPTAGTVDLAALAHEVEDAVVVGQPGLPRAEGEPDVIRRALQPLVENARRHARTGVVLELSAAHGRVRLAVKDDGPGLDPSIGDTAFDPGVRGPGTAGTLGAGLGLPLARRLARSCGGDVTAGPGPGGEFLLELPAAG